LTRLRGPFSRWLWDVSFQSKEGRPEQLLYHILDNAERLHGQLDDIVTNSDVGRSSLLLNVGIRLQDALVKAAATDAEEKLGLPQVQFVIRRLIRALEVAIEGGRTSPRGALPDLVYPGLGALVFGLARSAHLSGGKFTAHRKIAKKGTLVRPSTRYGTAACKAAISNAPHYWPKRFHDQAHTP
jgi:hypothetical protein